DGYFFRTWPSCTMSAHSCSDGTCANYPSTLLFCQGMFPDSLSVGNITAVDTACKEAPCGKLTSEALYIHMTGLPHLPPILRIYEGCARAFIGLVEGANIVKLHRHIPQVSYLSYPEFDRDPHPALVDSLVVHLQTFQVRYFNYK